MLSREQDQGGLAGGLPATTARARLVAAVGAGAAMRPWRYGGRRLGEEVVSIGQRRRILPTPAILVVASHRRRMSAGGLPSADRGTMVGSRLPRGPEEAAACEGVP